MPTLCHLLLSFITSIVPTPSGPPALPPGLLYAIVADSRCPDNYMAGGCETGGMLLLTGDSLLLMPGPGSPRRGRTSYAARPVGDTLLLGEDFGTFVVRREQSYATLTEPHRDYTLTLRALPSAKEVVRVPDDAQLQLSGGLPFKRTLWLPDASCRDHPTEDLVSNIGFADGAPRDFAVLPRKRTAVGEYSVTHVMGRGYFVFTGTESESGYYDHLNNQARFESGTFRIPADQAGDLRRPLTGSWKATDSIGYRDLRRQPARRYSSPLGYHYPAFVPYLDPPPALLSEEVYQFSLEVDATGLRILMNGELYASFDRLQELAGDQNLIIAANEECRYLTLELDQEGDTLTTELDLTFPAGDRTESFPVPLTFERR